MVQKVIKIGSSLGITIPSKEVAALQLVAGDNVEITIYKKIDRLSKHAELLQELDNFMDTYGEDLRKLAQR